MERLLAYWIVGMACLAAGPSAASAAYPSQPVKIVIQAAAGNGPDALARLIADRLTALWNQQVLVINRPGAGGLIAAQAAASATPDGYTLYMPSSSTFLVLPASHGKLPFDLERDFEPIGLVAKSPIVIAVAPALGVRSVPDLIAVARQRPGLLYAALNRGTLPHVISELFQRRAGIQMTYVPYSGTPQALNDILGGRLSIIFDGMGALSGAMEAGHVKAIAITSATRLAHLPDLATVSETLPDFTLMAWNPLLAPAGTPQHIVEKVGMDLRTVLEHPIVKERFGLLGTVTEPMSPAELRAFIRSERERWQPLLDEIAAPAR